MTDKHFNHNLINLYKGLRKKIMFAFAQTQTNPLRQAITAAYRRDEEEAVADMLQRAAMSAEEKQAADQLARSLVKKVRADRSKASGVDALMQEFTLSSE